MVKAGKWIKSILIGSKKDKQKLQKEKQNSSKIPSSTPIVITPSIPKEKKRWSFRRSSSVTSSKDPNLNHSTPTTKPEVEKLNKPNLDVVKARKALRALRGLVKLQALVRGRLVRKRANATLKCMEALITAQARARAQRIRSVYHIRDTYHEMEKGMMEENIKIVEMDIGESKSKPKTKNNNNYSYYQTNERRDDRFSTHYASDSEYTKQDYYYNNNNKNNKISPSPSQITDISPRTCSGHIEDYYYYSSISKANQQQNSDSLPYDYPSYMANTQSSRAKARSQSAPKLRPDSFERQMSKRRPSVEGRSNIPRAVRMQRSSSNVGPTSHYPWSIKLDKSSVSVMESECGSNCSVLTTANYCRPGVLPYDNQGHRY
ncbi:hypothetical protein V2J09_014200 [Rumex salicifolius]